MADVVKLKEKVVRLQEKAKKFSSDEKKKEILKKIRKRLKKTQRRVKSIASAETRLKAKLAGKKKVEAVEEKKEEAPKAAEGAA
ncbi:MAG: hypothetical protein AABY58_01960 [Nitrospirota bacterium]|mgnify:FL=1|jgi:hypothetical protein